MRVALIAHVSSHVLREAAMQRAFAMHSGRFFFFFDAVICPARGLLNT